MKAQPSERRQFGWSQFSTRLKALNFVVVGLVILMSTAHFLGIDTGDATRGDDLISGLLGQGEGRSRVWLWIARISMIGILITVVLMRREEKEMARHRRDRADARVESL